MKGKDEFTSMTARFYPMTLEQLQQAAQELGLRRFSRLSREELLSDVVMAAMLAEEKADYEASR